MNCPNCGAPNNEGATFCANCGTSLANQAPQYQQPVYQHPAYGYQPAQPASVPGKGLGIAGMVLGIIGLVLVCTGWVSIICSLVGLILSGVGMSKAKAVGAKNGMAVAGLVCSCIAIGVYVIIIALGTAFLAELGLYL